MSTSGSTDYGQTVRQVITNALELIGAIGLNDTPAAEDSATGLKHLELLLKTWGTDPKLFIEAETSLTLVASTASYSLPLARRVTEARRRTDNIDTPLEVFSREKYFNISNKTQTGTPLGVFFDPQRSARTLYVWNVPDATVAADTTIRYTYHRVIEDADSLNNDPDVPQEWLEALTYALAARLTLPFKTSLSQAAVVVEVKERAAILYAQLTADSQEDGSVFMQPFAA